MFIINILSYCKDITMIQYLFCASGFYGLFLCLRKLVLNK